MGSAIATDVPHLILPELLAFSIIHFFGGVMFFAPCGQKHSLTMTDGQSDLNHG